MQNYFTFQIPGIVSQSSSNAGSWSFHENLNYAIFIDIHKKSMTSKKKMREIHFYDKLSLFVGTRTSPQCRSHHQKVFAKFKYISKITQIFKNQLGISAYKVQILEGINRMKNINETFSKSDHFQNSHQEQEEDQDHQGVIAPGNLPDAGSINQIRQGYQGNPTVVAFPMTTLQMMNGGLSWVDVGGRLTPIFISSYLL